MAFPFSKVGGSFLLGFLRLLIFGVSVHFYVLGYFLYFKARKPTFLYYGSNLVGKTLACLKTSTF